CYVCRRDLPTFPTRRSSDLPLVTRSNVSGRVATSECWPEAMTHYRKWSLSASIRCKRPRQINAGRSTVIVQGWCWEKALHFWHWKISTSLNSEVRQSLQKSSATAFPQIIITSHSRILPASGRKRRWSERYTARKF